MTADGLLLRLAANLRGAKSGGTCQAKEETLMHLFDKLLLVITALHHHQPGSLVRFPKDHGREGEAQVARPESSPHLDRVRPLPYSSELRASPSSTGLLRQHVMVDPERYPINESPRLFSLGLPNSDKVSWEAVMMASTYARQHVDGDGCVRSSCGVPDLHDFRLAVYPLTLPLI